MKNTVFLNTNREMPLLGLGVYKATGENEAERAIVSAVENGYRLIDTASAYKNEENVGRGIASVGFPEVNFLLLPKSGTQHSVLAISAEPSSAVWTV